MIMGVTALPASSIRVIFAGSGAPLTVDTVTVSAIPGIRFFAAPVSTLSTKFVRAIGTNNRILAQVQWPPLPPPTSVVSIPS
jgi:hypothetical protein